MEVRAREENGDAENAPEYEEMSIVPIGHLQLTQADVTVLLEFGRNLIRKKLASACVPSATDDGTPVVVFVNSTGYHLLYAVCREFGFYYAMDRDGAVLAESRLLHELIEALPENRHVKRARHGRLSQKRARTCVFKCPDSWISRKGGPQTRDRAV